MLASVYKICACRDKLKCRHPWWFGLKRPGERRIRKSLDVVLERRIDSKTVAEQEANRLRLGIVDDSLPARTRQLLGLPASSKPALDVLTLGQLLARYHERHVAQLAGAGRQAYQMGTITRAVVVRADGTSAPLGGWCVRDITADTLERLRAARIGRVYTRETGSNVLGGPVAANRDLRLLRAAFNWAIRVGYVDTTPFKRGTVAWQRSP